jgi:hypothetical protein
MFHCFGCGVSGDAIKFVMQLESMSFREAVERLAADAGVDLTPPDPEEARRSQRRAQLAEVNEKACTFYERVLWEHPKGEIAREHLRQRGITEDTARAWRLGYAPNLWDSLCKSHALKGVEPKLVEEAGLGVPRKKGEGLYDRFRGRLIIPIRESGRIVGFGGRLLEGQSEAKYLNSPDTPLYQKGQTLFALDRAREAIRREGVALFVEGYFDAIGLHQAAVQTAVATCGTALTDKHLELVTKAGAGAGAAGRRGSRRDRAAGGHAGLSRDALGGAAVARVPPRSRPLGAAQRRAHRGPGAGGRRGQGHRPGRAQRAGARSLRREGGREGLRLARRRAPRALGQASPAGGKACARPHREGSR